MYLSQAADGFHLAKGARYIRRVTQSSLFLDVIDREVKPGLDVVPANATTAEWESRVHSHVGTEYRKMSRQYRKFRDSLYNLHLDPIGTASMLPRSARGVVDTQLKVYGTKVHIPRCDAPTKLMYNIQLEPQSCGRQHHATAPFHSRELHARCVSPPDSNSVTDPVYRVRQRGKGSRYNNRTGVDRCTSPCNPVHTMPFTAKHAWGRPQAHVESP